MFSPFVREILLTSHVTANPCVGTMELDDNPTHKAHRKSKSGVKAEKKKASKQKKLNQDKDVMRERNPKVYPHLVENPPSDNLVGFHSRCQEQEGPTDKTG